MPTLKKQKHKNPDPKVNSQKMYMPPAPAVLKHTVCFQLQMLDSVIHIQLYLPLSLHHPSMCAKITKAANEQECPQISETARQL